MEMALNRVVKTIPAKTRAQILERTDSRKDRTCAYARVSTDRAEQEDSYERQVEHYTNFIKNNSDWDYAGIFADPAITGTRADKRPEFNKMIQACREKKIDRVIVKCISRFARNTVDALTYIRELKDMGIPIYFEVEHIDTMTPGGEILITVLAALAEQESRNIAKNVTWAYEKKFLKGDILLNTKRFLGYKKNEDGTLSIVPEEAAIVKRIYSEYLQGFSTAQICSHLKADGVLTPCGKENWAPSTVLSILRNEKYMGTVIQGKTFKPDVLSKKRYKNIGQKELYTIEDCMPEIISKKMFSLVQNQIKDRGQLRSVTITGDGKFSSKYVFSGMLYCQECGSKFRRHAAYRKGETIRTWTCPTHVIHGDGECKMLYVREDSVKEAYLSALHSIDKDEYKGIVDTLKANIAKEQTDGDAERIEEIGKEIDNIREQIISANREKRRGTMSNSSYDEKVSDCENRITHFEEERTKRIDRCAGIETIKNRIAQMNAVLNKLQENVEFDEGLFRQLVERVKVYKDHTADFVFKCGITVREKIE